ncbi:MAG: glycosyltransferase family 2 protein [Deltaproteobacteria bacterium]|nr:glycosyltransferase family 2 protein [Deltaproteobacteria bacterium]
MGVLIYPLFAVYGLAVILLFLYGVNSYYLVYQFVKNRRRSEQNDEAVVREYWNDKSYENLPLVTIQLPIYNEQYVVERLIRSACNIDYAPGKVEIQVLDDSTDETKDLVVKIVDRYREMGHDVHHITRPTREGYKAGALKFGMERCRGEFIAIFDADFMPPKDFLYKTVPYFSNPKIGLVQTRWSHVNADYSFLTLAQSLGIDGHFVVEQAGRAWGNLFMNFNGTAGIWRKETIESAGGWQADTLTEDMDLSYRAQLAGWKMHFLHNVCTPAEIPVDINAFKSQQHRWAKGSIQTAKKILPMLFSTDEPLRRKVQAVVHMTHYMVHPLMVTVALLSIPMLRYFEINFTPLAFGLLVFLLLIATTGPSSLYMFSQRTLNPENWRRKIAFIPALMFIGTGIALSNTKAVLEALFNRPSEFVRTPKLNILMKGDKVDDRKYRMPLRPVFLLELLMGAYCFAGFLLYLDSGKYLIGPFLAIYTVGFTYTGIMSILHSIQGPSGQLSEKAVNA